MDTKPVTPSVPDIPPPSPPAGGGSSPPANPPANGPAVGTRPDFRLKFAIGTFIVAVIVAIAAFKVFELTKSLGLSKEEWAKLSANGQFAARVTAILLAFGAITLVLGAWMAVVEWRGSFDRGSTTQGIDPEKVIEAVGKLRGAVLVMVVGALLMLGAAWVASSAAAPPASTTPTTPAGPVHSGTPAPTAPGG